MNYVKKVLILTAIILAFSACELQAAVTHSTWLGGEEGEWARASNWDPASVPDNSSWRTFAVTIDGNSVGDAFVGLRQGHTIDQLDCYGTVELERVTSDWVELTLLDPRGLTNHGELISWGMQFNGNVTNASGATLEVSQVQIVGNLYNFAGATVHCEGEFDVDTGQIHNAGVMNVWPGADLWPGGGFHNTGNIHIFGGECGQDELFDNDSNGVIEGFGAIRTDPEGIIQNKGTICANSGTLLLHSDLTNTGTLANKAVSSLHIRPSVDVNNLGTIEVNASGGVAFDCNMVNLNDPNATIKLLGGTFSAKLLPNRLGQPSKVLVESPVMLSLIPTR